MELDVDRWVWLVLHASRKTTVVAGVAVAGELWSTIMPVGQTSAHPVTGMIADETQVTKP